MKAVTAKTLSDAWRKYRELFGEAPHGTEQQMAALLEFAHDDDYVTISLAEAQLLNGAFLPLNPNKLRNAAPGVASAAHSFKSVVNQKLIKKLPCMVKPCRGLSSTKATDTRS